VSSLTFLVNHAVHKPANIDGQVWGAAIAREREVAAERLRNGVITGMWRVPGQSANWGIWSVESAEELHELLTSLPLAQWSTFDIHLLAHHPLMDSEDT
jgi:muconolactone D-isomerase